MGFELTTFSGDRQIVQVVVAADFGCNRRSIGIRTHRRVLSLFLNRGDI